jgi:hypothetical protein
VLFSSMLEGSLCSLMKSIKVTCQSTSIIKTTQLGSVGPLAMAL